MFHIPKEEITFVKVHEFCQLNLKEDLDLDYKSDWPKDLARIICGMANVQGGMILIGVDEIPGTRQPNWPPPGVEGKEDDLHQRAVQIAYDAIYPPAMPEIAVCPLDTDPRRAVVVIRVEASRLLHATDNRRRVYVRVADQGRGYELADLSQLEWLFSQREASITLRQAVLDRASERSSRFASGTPLLVMYATPVFPNQVKQANPPSLLKLVKEIPSAEAPWPGASGLTVPTYPRWRTTSQGIFTRMLEDPKQYLELGIGGLIYLTQELRTFDDERTSSLRYLRSAGVLAMCEAFLRYATTTYTKQNWRGPTLLHFNLMGVQNVHLDHRILGKSYQIFDGLTDTSSQDSSIKLYEDECSARELVNIRDEILDEIAYSMFWSFGYSDNPEDIRNKYLAQLRGQTPQ